MSPTNNNGNAQRASQAVNGTRHHQTNGNHVNGHQINGNSSTPGAQGPSNIAPSNNNNNNNNNTTPNHSTTSPPRPVGSVSPGGTTITQRQTTVTQSPGGTITEEISEQYHHRIPWNPDHFAVVYSESGDMSFDRRDLIGTRLANGQIVVDICRRCHCAVVESVMHRCPSNNPR